MMKRLITYATLAAALCLGASPAFAQNAPARDSLSAPPDTTVADTVAADTMAADTTDTDAAVTDTSAEDAVPENQAAPERAVENTVVMDTVATASTPNAAQAVSVVGGQNQSPTGLTRVRRRIAQIRGTSTGSNGPVVVPILIMPTGSGTAASSAAPSTGSPVPPASSVAPSGASAPNGLTQADLARMENRIMQRLNSRFDELYFALEGRRPDPSSTTVISPNLGARDSVAATPLVPPAAPETVVVRETTPAAPGQPTVREIERAILETGLFRALGVNFEFNQSTLLPEAETSLDAVGEVLTKYPDLRVEVAGHTDNVGSDAYNQQLSQARAGSVRSYLLENFDIVQSRINANGYGEAQPIASNTTETGRALNRRVEFRLLNPEAAEQYIERTRPDTAAQGESLQDMIRRTIREEMTRPARTDTSGQQ